MADSIRATRTRFFSYLSIGTLAVGAAILVAGCASLGSKPPRAANLTGDWKMDQALSEDPNGVMRQLRQSSRGGGGGGGSHRRGGGMGGGGMGGGMGMPRGGGGGGSGSGGYGGGGSGGRGSHGSPMLPDFLSQPASLAIKQMPQELALDADGVSTKFVYGEKVVTSVLGGTAERVCGWKGSDFVVKYKVTEGSAATRSYEVGDGGRRLIVTTAVEGGRIPKFEFRTVYERVPAS